MKKIINIALSIIALSLITGSGNAMPVPITSSNGQLIGANNVLVSGDLYDVQFYGDGSSFNNLFFDEAGLDATTDEEAAEFSRALLDQVFVGIYDSSPTLISDCANQEVCIAITPYDIVSPRFRGIGAQNFVDNNLDNISPYGSFTLNLNINSVEGIFIFADWNKVIRSVPEPKLTVLLIFMVCLIGYLSLRRIKTYEQACAP